MFRLAYLAWETILGTYREMAGDHDALPGMIAGTPTVAAGCGPNRPPQAKSKSTALSRMIQGFVGRTEQLVMLPELRSLAKR